MIWDIFCGIPKHHPDRHIPPTPFRFSDGNVTLWMGPKNMQHPLAKIEIVAFDSIMTMFQGANTNLMTQLRSLYPLTEDE